MRLVLPRLYVILDAALITSPERDCALSLAEAGVRLIQYRNKSASARQYLDSSRELADALRPRGVTFLVHVGQDDLEVEQAHRVAGQDKLVGVSTHNLEQFNEAVASSADYIAIGPLFSTTSKANPDPVVGLDFLRKVRGLTDKPIVGIGGISLDRAKSVIEAGADSVAVISGVLGAPNPSQSARQYLEVLETAKHAAAY
jgi:thiamine-phosphate pyrophosphorylase